MRNTTYKCWLSVAYVSCLMISNIITNKQILMPYGFVITAGVFVFPFTYVLSDVFSEVYGYKWSRTTCYMGFSANLFMAIVFFLTLRAGYPSYWQDQMAFETVLGSVPRVLAASLAAFVVGDFVNDVVFAKMRARGGCFEGRALLSSVCGEIVDSLIFLPIVFGGRLPVKEIVAIGLTEVIIKLLIELAVLPITTMLIRVLDDGGNSV